jgi:M6 family metalloprotease-like protein
LATAGVAAMMPAGLLIGPGAPAVAAPAGDCRLQQSPSIDNEHEGPTDYTRWLRPKGTLRAVYLFVDFSDAPGSGKELAARRSLFATAPGDWLRTSSYGRVSLAATFTTEWARMPQPQTAYAGIETSFVAQRDYIQDAVTAWEDALDFTTYDLVYVVSPKAATARSISPAYIAPPGWGVYADGVELRHGATFGGDVDYWGYKIVDHETGHVFGLPDLYTYGAGWPALHESVGGWDVMGTIEGPAPDYLAWHKWKLGWLDDTQISCVTAHGSRTVTLTPLGTKGGVKAAVVKVSEQRAIVVENRQIDKLDVASPCLRPGILVYAVDTAVGGGHKPVRVLDAQPGKAVAGCVADHGQLDNATLTTLKQQVTDPVSGVRITLTGISGTRRTVKVTW